MPISFCTCSNTSRSMIGSWTFLKIAHLSSGLAYLVLFLKDLEQVLKLIISPQYSRCARILDTVVLHHLYGFGCVFFPPLGSPLLCQYAIGTSTFFSCRMRAIVSAPFPSKVILKISFTTSAASGSMIHFFLFSGLFIYPYGG